MTRFLTFVAVTAALLVATSTANAHHGWAAFDTNKTITLKGKVTDFHFVNPHCVVEFEAADEQGHSQQWQAELTSASRLAPKGWTATTLEAGDEVTITGYAAKNGTPSIWVTRIVLPNGKEFKLSSGY